MIDYKYLLQNGMHVSFALVILIASLVIGKQVDNMIYTRAAEKNASVVLLGHAAYYVILLIGFMVILRVFGIEIASIVALLAALGFAIGLSLQGSLSDIASGILITFFKIFNIGDVIQIDDLEGKVVDFKLIHTLIEDVNTKSIVTIPNRRMQDTPVINITKQGFHYFVVDMLLSNANKDFAGILNMMRQELKDTKKFPDVLQNMPHRVSIADMSNVGTVMRIRVPVTTENDVAVKRGDIRNAIRSILESKKILLIDPTAITRSTA